jgi:hypothetical protein
MQNPDYQPDTPLWKSHVFFKEKCYFVSTIERSYHTYVGASRGLETIVWEYDWDKRERGRLVYQAGGVADHQAICRCLIAEGVLPDEENESHQRFFR